MANLFQNSRFSQNPVDINIQRSKSNKPFEHKTTFSAGRLIPIFWEEVLPGSTYELNTSALIRMSTSIHPTMDNCFVDIAFFFVPNRLVWQHWEAFNGQNDETYWTQPTEYNVPALTFPRNGFSKGSVADYLGLPTYVCASIIGGSETPGVIDGYINEYMNHLPFRAYVKIWNDWWRDQNSMDPAYFVTDDSDRQGVNLLDGFPDQAYPGHMSALYGGECLPVSKFHDYFTSCLPQPQKGDPVTVPFQGSIPVMTGGKVRYPNDNDAAPLYWSYSTSPNDGVMDYGPLYVADNGSTEQGLASSYSSQASLVPSNLWAKADYAPIGILVNDMRTAFQIQRLLEKDALYGSRYIEILKSHFGVDSPDGRLQRSEYLGGDRFVINMSQVVQTSATNEISPQGNASGISVTPSSSHSFSKSFTEHGFIIGVACVRTSQTYQQGINQMWSRRRRFDYYWPSLAHLGNQPVLKKELYLAGETFDNDHNELCIALNGIMGSEVPINTNNEAFGFQEAWASYRYKPSMVTGAFRSNYAQSLDSWHYANDFDFGNFTPYLNADFLIQDKEGIDRTLAVSSEVEDQFIADFHFDIQCVMPMPMYSFPGLIDHF